MVRAWVLNSEIEDPKEMNLTLPPQYVSLDDLQACCGIEFFEIHSEVDENLDRLKKDRGVVTSMNIKSLVGFELKSLFVEHLLNDDVYYLTLQGSGYLDIRDNNDQWIRIEVVKGDMIGIKKNSFRRFTVDHNEKHEGKMYMKDDKIRCFIRPQISAERQ
ncbi:acireductone dioxygenase [Aethina tumida]|uniref:acireductone dioxygenase n=1 Tax=Aethina tumida TaxID=116153 RepID=UPI00096AFA39|nr:acireductone dioxygenase [Aethina tumida]XP_049820997.1 acireductone dioxygenase [Aethina tumida]